MTRRATFRLADAHRAIEGARRAGARRVTIDLRQGTAKVDFDEEPTAPIPAAPPEPRGRKYVF